MNLRVFLVATLLVLVVAAPVSALATKYWEAKLYPEEGSTTQSITILVRMKSGEETVGTTPRYVYVFYDGIVLLKSQASPYSASVGYTYKWDLTVSVPQTEAATAYGEHEVMVRLEESDGSYTESEYTYTISSGKPVEPWWKSVVTAFWIQLGDSIDWGALWENCPPEILAQLKGEPGTDGKDGKDATVDYGKLADNLDYAALWDSIPADTLAEMKGAKGDAGAAGKDVDPMLLYMALLLSVLGNVGAWILPWIKERKRVNPPLA